ncbi:MAG: o-succinylbenzoate synthase [Actinomycetota bacterium]
MHPFSIPMKVRFRGIERRDGLLLHGPSGWGEFSPFPGYDAAESRAWARAAHEAAYGAWPPPRRTSIPVNATVPAVDGPAAYNLVKRSGCTSVKVKVAEGDDHERVAAVRDALGPAGKLRIDVNGLWDIDTAARRIKELDRYDLEYVEQPTRTLQEMAALRRRVDVPLAADESIRKADDPLRVAGLEAADIVVLKVQPLGGVNAALQIAEACGLPAVVSSALETSVGIAAGLALAAALPELPYACGLATVALLDGDVVTDPLVPRNGAIEFRRPEVDADALAAFATEDDTMIARYRAAAALGGSIGAPL